MFLSGTSSTTFDQMCMLDAALWDDDYPGERVVINEHGGLGNLDRLVAHRLSKSKDRRRHHDLAYWIMLLREGECTDMRDRFYSMLELCSVAEAKYRLEADYTVGIPQLHFRVCHASFLSCTTPVHPAYLFRWLGVHNLREETIDAVKQSIDPQELYCPMQWIVRGPELGMFTKSKGSICQGRNCLWSQRESLHFRYRVVGDWQADLIQRWIIGGVSRLGAAEIVHDEGRTAESAAADRCVPSNIGFTATAGSH